ncbi:Cation diffusion facilitator [Rasamsonia emersonii CBS 393.64]|uniref:Cation diffusion facilitator n=1 Tax=Rasamsonia emersonii (strain ATCC 16479 / CBS 393.64 / IMI 116815) TaxID=1408163 RepID=A0A0F4YFU2_RASE3|nr:Cation diffusion facilitator [Rasamsonia emersonii CBS 393.64]KKA16985.1 Cation diffusion facilitator [Rasamsonia emersonii CBS 393.64]
MSSLRRSDSSQLSSFLPLCPEPTWQMMSTRGQTLPGLIRRYSISDSTTEPDGRRAALETEVNDDLEAGSARISSNNALLTNANEPEQLSAASSSSVSERLHRRSSLLIGDTTSPFRWQEFYTPPEQLRKLRKPVRYLYVDRLLDSSIAHDLIENYDRQWAKNRRRLQLQPIAEESPADEAENGSYRQDSVHESITTHKTQHVNHQLNERTPLLLSPTEETPLLGPKMESAQNTRRVVLTAIYVNLLANVLLLAAKIVITVMTSSVSVLASLVDAALDFLSTAIVWSTTRLTARRDRHRYPVGRRRLEPVGVLIFATVMVTSFFQVAIVSLQRLTGEDHALVQLGTDAIAIMGATVAVKLLCWLWCRRINDSNVQALAQDAMTDIVFNLFSIIFPLVGTYANLWFLDPAGGLALSVYVMGNWARTANEHIAHLTGAAASPDERSVLLYLVMRFAASIRWIQNLEAYHSGDRLNVEVDIVLDEHTTLHDSHDLGESLQHMLESVGNVDRAFVHLDYAEYNLPTHIDQDARVAMQ